jgi:hypothetical protein
VPHCSPVWTNPSFAAIAGDGSHLLDPEPEEPVVVSWPAVSRLASTLSGGIDTSSSRSERIDPLATGTSSPKVLERVHA